MLGFWGLGDNSVTIVGATGFNCNAWHFSRVLADNLCHAGEVEVNIKVK